MISYNDHRPAIHRFHFAAGKMNLVFDPSGITSLSTFREGVASIKYKLVTLQDFASAAPLDQKFCRTLDVLADRLDRNEASPGLLLMSLKALEANIIDYERTAKRNTEIYKACMRDLERGLRTLVHSHSSRSREIESAVATIAIPETLVPALDAKSTRIVLSVKSSSEFSAPAKGAVEDSRADLKVSRGLACSAKLLAYHALDLANLGQALAGVSPQDLSPSLSKIDNEVRSFVAMAGLGTRTPENVDARPLAVAAV